MKSGITALILLGLALAGEAQAQTRLRESAPPLTIQRRSYLDPGTQVPVGSRSRYVQQLTTMERPEWSMIGAGRGFGYETLPRRFEPGR